MTWTSSDNGMEVYVIYADLFLMLFMIAILMMGDNSQLSAKTSEQVAMNNGAQETVISLYVDSEGELFRDEEYRTAVKAGEIPDLLHRLNTRRVVVHPYENLSINVYAKIQTVLEQSGAIVSYTITQGEKPYE